MSGPKKNASVRLGAAALFLCAAFVFSGKLVGFFEDVLYQDRVIYARDTKYQRIVITRWRNDLRLFLNGHLQFCSIDEARYHEALVIPAMEAAAPVHDVLILGGGDGLAAREVLKYPSVEHITLVDIDPRMTSLASRRPDLLELNKESLKSPKVKIINQDAMRFVQDDEGFYQVILIDLPDPNSEALAKLYSTSFYALCARRLSADGVMTTQAGSPFHAPEAFWCIEKTMSQAIAPEKDLTPLITVPYHLNVPSFGDWGFVMASKRKIDPAILKPSEKTRYLTPQSMSAMFVFGLDDSPRNVEVNRLDKPVVHNYYRIGWERF